MPAARSQSCGTRSSRRSRSRSVASSLKSELRAAARDSYVVSGFSRTARLKASRSVEADDESGGRAFPPPLGGNPASVGDSPERQRRQASRGRSAESLALRRGPMMNSSGFEQEDRRSGESSVDRTEQLLCS